MTLQHQSLDRINALPQDIIEKIMTHMSIRDALRTSVLSRKWRYSWTTMPKLVFDMDLVKSSCNRQLDEYKSVKAIFHVLLLHRAPILEFSLYANAKYCSEVDQIILHLSRSNNIKKLVFWAWGLDYMLPRSFFSILQGLEHLRLQYCAFELPSMTKEFSAMKSLCFYDVSITNKMVFEFLTKCPLLENFAWSGDKMELTVCELIDLFKCLPSVKVLETLMLHITPLAAGGMPNKLPISLPHLRILVLGVCFLELSNVLYMISSFPNLEKIEIRMCCNHDGGCRKQTFNNLPDIQDYTGLYLDHLKEIKIINFKDHALEMDFVKLIMAKSPVLKKAV